MYWILKTSSSCLSPGETVYWADIFAPESQAGGGPWTTHRERARRFFAKNEAVEYARAMPLSGCRVIRVTRKGGS